MDHFPLFLALKVGFCRQRHLVVPWSGACLMGHLCSHMGGVQAGPALYLACHVSWEIIFEPSVIPWCIRVRVVVSVWRSSCGAVFSGFFVPFSPPSLGSGPRRLRLCPSVFRGVRAMFRPPGTACYLSHYLGLSMVCRPWRHPPDVLLRGLWRCASGLGWVVSMRVCRPVWLAGHAGVGHGWSLGIP